MAAEDTGDVDKRGKNRSVQEICGDTSYRARKKRKVGRSMQKKERKMSMKRESKRKRGRKEGISMQ